MRFAQQFQDQTVNGQGYRWAGAYRIGRTRRPHCLFKSRRHWSDKMKSSNAFSTPTSSAQLSGIFMRAPTKPRMRKWSRKLVGLLSSQWIHYGKLSA